MSAAKTILGILAFAILLVILASVFTITQGQHGILLRLGRLVMDNHSQNVKILGPGLHIKTPFIENVRVFDTRIQTLDIKSSRIVTKEKKDVIVDYYVKWQIADLAQYYKSTGGNEFKAETLLEQQLNTSLRAEFGRRTISDVSGGREDLTEKLRSKAEQQASQLGIKIVDVRIKGIELPENTSNNIFQLMRANMQKIANSHRADGNAIAEAIKAAADAQVTVLLAQAQSEGQKIKARGQAEAARIYAEAFNKNPEFFAFYRSLKAYKGSFNNKRDILILDQSSAFFDYFKSAGRKGDGTNLKN
ncbi:protease modulator HflC [Legionella hackeliae]|uniref:Protein HflC n=1 Tax=Legionella hackeliae TaxID=449 RepID=A0A0A8UQB4_LEGHA|nr:protease modulator HflC [Legionella hackeliae]KTD10191.1 HflC protein [Legionella hackeliae]CEK09686.1 Protein hflC [Legionella hackeliae]STX49596.1 HflC protein [Legionella hackeliae]